MATTAFRSPDCFRDRIHPESLTLTHPLKFGGKSRPNYVSDNEFGSHRTHGSLAGFREGDGRWRSRSRSRSTVVETPAKSLVMGKVKILKRGETLSSLRKVADCVGDGESNGPEDFDMFLGSTSRLGPDAETVQRQISFRDGLGPAGNVFAGSELSFSPSPSSLPIPSFLARNK